MKKHTLFVAIFIAIVACSQFLQAQSNRRLIANIPFQFQAGDKTLSAGIYEVVQIGSNSYALRNQSNGTTTLLHPGSSVVGKSIPQFGKLIFRKYGEQAFLAQIWKPANQLGAELLKSRAEKQIQVKVAEKQLVAVVLNK